MKRILVGLLAAAVSTLSTMGVEDNNPCTHKNMVFSTYVGTVSISQTGNVEEQKGSCASAVDVCALAKSVVSINDTFKMKYICDDCEKYEEYREQEGHNPQKVASHYPSGGDYAVTGAGTYRVSVGVSCGCGKCTVSSPSNIIIPVTISHNYQEAEECDVSVVWYDQPGGPTPPDALQDCTLTQAGAKQQAEQLGRVAGHCYTFEKCSSCGAERARNDHLNVTTGASGGELAYSIYKKVQCEHRNDRKDYTITLQHILNLKNGVLQGNCNYEGVPTYYSVQMPNVSVPVGDTKTFNVNFNEVSRGSTKYTGYECSRCSLDRNFAEPLLISHEPGTVQPPQVGSGELLDPQPQYPYSIKFNSIGETQVTFQHLCQTLQDRTLIHEGMTFEHIDVPGCSQSKAGEYEFAVKVMTVADLNVTSEKVVREIPAAALPALPSYEPEPTKNIYVKAYTPETEESPAQWETVLDATSTPTGDWPEGYPVWTRYPQYQGPAPDPLLLPVEGEPGKRLSHPSPGVYVIVARCGINNQEVAEEDQLQPNPAHAKSLALCVVDPEAVAEFDVEKNSEGQKVISYLTPCNVVPIKITFGADMNYMPEGEKAVLTIDADPQTYELYKDPNGLLEAGAEDLELEITSTQFRKTVYLWPLQDDAQTLTNTYKIKTQYGLSGSSIKADGGEDILTINWAEGGCSDGSCAVPHISAQNNSVQVQGSFGIGAWGNNGGSYQIYSKGLNYRLLDNAFLNNGTDENGNAIILDPMLRFAFDSNSTVKMATEADEAANNSSVAGYPIRVCTGRYCSEITYRKTTIGDFTFIDKMTITQYLSTNMDPSIAMTGTPVAETIIELISENNNPSEGTEPEITEFTVTNTQYGGESSSTQTWSFTIPDATCPDLTGEYTISQLNWNGVNNILVKQDYSANGSQYRREIRYIGSMTNPVSKEEKIYRMFDWGEEIISETTNGKTTTYEYYTEGNGKSLLKKITYPQGDSVTSVYNSDNNLASQTELRGTLSYVTTFEYAYDEANKKRTITTVKRVGETVVSKNSTVVYEEESNSYPNENIAYDENDIAYVTKIWYEQGPNGVYDRRISRQENPDGTVTVYSYNRSGDSETTTTESGIFSGNTLTLGTRQVSVSNSNGVNVSSESWFIDTANNVNVKTSSTINSNFDEFGRALTTTYLDGSTVTRTYGCCGVETETDRDGIVTTYAYDDFKRVSYTVRDGITTLYSYDELGNQTAVTTKGRDDGEITTSSTYSNGELASTTDALGNVTTYTRTYATNGTETTYTETTTNPDDSTQITASVNGVQTSVGGTAVHGQTMSYGANWQLTTTPVSDDINMTVKRYTDMLGRNYKTEYADGTFSINYYNAKNQIIKSVSPGGITTLYEYDALGRSTKQAIDMNNNGEIDSSDLVTAFVYSYGTQDDKTVEISMQTRSQGSDIAVISIHKRSVDGLEGWNTNLNGLTTHTKLERLGNGVTRQTVTNPDGTQVITNTANGKTTTVQQVNSDGTNGNLVTYTYDEFDRVVQMLETVGETTVNTTTMTYNANGAVLTQTVNGQTTSFEYDNMGRRTKVTAPGGVVANMTYYSTGEVKRVDGATYPVEYTYNGLGQQATLKTFKDASTPQVTSWSYNSRGQKIAKTYADDSSVTYTYNGDGQLLTRTWARQVNGAPLVTTYSYDAAGRQTGYSYSDGVTPAVGMTLNFLDLPVSITDAAGTRTLSYNDANLLTSETNPVIANSGFTYTYDTAGRGTAMSFGNGTTTFANAAYSYDSTGRIATVGNSADTLTYGYVPGTNMIGSATWQEASINTVNTYDQYKRLTNIAVNNISVYGYTLNDKNQRTGATLPDGRTWSYSYDTLGQLTGAVKRDSANTQLADLSYLYDQIGNRTSATENNTTTTYTSNLVNQYIQIASQVPTYDADGNMTSYNGWTYTWNGENRLIAAENSDIRLEFSYDYMGRRLYKKIYTDDTLTGHRKFVYDGYKLIAEFDALESDTLVASYLWQPESVGVDVPLMRIADNAEAYYIADGNKNIIALKDSSGADISTYTYTPFGALENPTDGDENPFRFSSEYADDEIGLVYYNFRYYSPVLGRWIKRDPLEEESGLLLYGMLINNTISLYDQLGLASKWEPFPSYPLFLRNIHQALKAEVASTNKNYRYVEAAFNFGSSFVSWLITGWLLESYKDFAFDALTSVLPAKIAFSGSVIKATSENGLAGGAMVAAKEAKSKIILSKLDDKTSSQMLGKTANELSQEILEDWINRIEYTEYYSIIQPFFFSPTMQGRVDTKLDLVHARVTMAMTGHDIRGFRPPVGEFRWLRFVYYVSAQINLETGGVRDMRWVLGASCKK